MSNWVEGLIIMGVPIVFSLIMHYAAGDCKKSPFHYFYKSDDNG